ncbi:MAG: DUF3419 family protein [Candidatus Eisenbacteria bacterium]|nr:DUF3419 family protein [Candidatus Eisenbacteria bacterium]
MSGVEQKAAFDFVRYASVWEDADILCEALAESARGGRVLSIASAGDNALALLTLDPAEVVAVDLNRAQIACVELRRVAFRRLDYEPLLAFLGVLPAADRNATYHRLRSELPADAARFWDDRPAEIASGVIHAGKFERYFTAFRTRILPLVHGAGMVRRLRTGRTLDEQRRFYSDRWNTWRWRLLFKLFFSRFVMGRLGRDPAFFDHVEGSVAERILERTRYALTEIPVASNPYLAYILTGSFPPEALPLYLRRSVFEAIRSSLDRLTAVVQPADQTAGPFHGFNLSDIFEYMSEAEHARVYAALLDRAAPGARLAYWNMLAPRGVPREETRARALPELAASLHARDQAWFYQRFHVDQVEASGG